MSPHLARLCQVVDLVLGEAEFTLPLTPEPMAEVRDVIKEMLGDELGTGISALSVEVFHRNTVVWVQILDGGHRMVIRTKCALTGELRNVRP